MRRRRIILYNRQHFFIEFCCWNPHHTILINFSRRFQNFKYSLLGKSRSIHDREINKRSKTLTNSRLKLFYRLIGFVFYQIPLIYTNDQPLFIFLNKGKNIQILTFYPTCRINHQNANIGTFYSPNRTYDRIIFYIFGHFPFLPDSGRIYQIKIKPEFIITSKNRVSCSTGYIRNNITVFTDKSIYDRRLSGIRASHNGKTRNIVLYRFFLFFRKTSDNIIEQISSSRAVDSRQCIRISQSERIKFCSSILPFIAVYFIGNQNYRFFRLP